MARIFVIDDQPQVLVISHKLKRAGHDVVHFYNGEEAIANISSHRPDLVLLDVMIPGLSGFEILRHARENPYTTAIPFIFISDRHLESDITKAYELGALDYITKPFNLDFLTLKVRNLFRLLDARRDSGASNP
ncbi:MAG TPA: response regulator [Planctomycetota bacterium]|nr:response regulator [Planctomycetota bacterium]